MLGQRLLWNPRGPWQLYPHNRFIGSSGSRTSGSVGLRSPTSR
jgi:hypothetical protein